MQIDISSSTITLAPAGLLAVQDGAGTRVLCRSGTLWVTQEGEVRDSILSAGEILTIRKPGRTVISALEAASLALFGPGVPEVSVQRQKLRAPRLIAESVACG